MFLQRSHWKQQGLQSRASTALHACVYQYPSTVSVDSIFHCLRLFHLPLSLPLSVPSPAVSVYSISLYSFSLFLPSLSLPHSPLSIRSLNTSASSALARNDELAEQGWRSDLQSLEFRETIGDVVLGCWGFGINGLALRNRGRVGSSACHLWNSANRLRA